MAIVEAKEAGVVLPVARPGGLFRALYLRLPHRVRAGLTTEQVEALRVAAAELGASNHPLDLRLVLPTPFGRCYLVFLCGHDRRGGRGVSFRTGNTATRVVLTAALAALVAGVAALVA